MYLYDLTFDKAPKMVLKEYFWPLNGQLDGDWWGLFDLKMVPASTSSAFATLFWEKWLLSFRKWCLQLARKNLFNFNVDESGLIKKVWSYFHCKFWIRMSCYSHCFLLFQHWWQLNRSRHRISHSQDQWNTSASFETQLGSILLAFFPLRIPMNFSQISKFLDPYTWVRIRHYYRLATHDIKLNRNFWLWAG